MTTTDFTSPDTFVISLPQGWAEVPLDPERLVEAVRTRAAAERPEEQIRSVEFRRTLVLLRRLAEQAQQGGVVFAATYTDLLPPPDSETAAGELYVLAAMGWLVTRRAAEFGVDLITFEQLRAAVAIEPSEPGVGRLEHPRVMDLPAGPAIRDVTLQQVTTPALDRPVEVVSCRYHLLIGAGAGMAVLGFQSPNVELLDELLGLFHSVAATLQFVAA